MSLDPIGMDEQPWSGPRVPENAEIERLARAGGDALRAEATVWLAAPALRAVAAGLVPRCDKCGKGAQRWAVDRALTIARLLKLEPQLLVAVFQRLGARDEEHLRVLVEAGLKLERIQADASASLADFREEAVELLRLVLVEHPEWRMGVLADLAGPAPVNGNGGRP